MAEKNEYGNRTQDTEIQEQAEIGTVRVAYLQNFTALRGLRPNDGIEAMSEDGAGKHLGQQRFPDIVHASGADVLAASA